MSQISSYLPSSLQNTSSSSILETLNKYKLYIAVLVVFFGVAAFCYIYIVKPKLSLNYKTNHEKMSTGQTTDSNNNTAELLFFYADWCPHCKTAKPIWNDMKTEYQNKKINGYNVMFTDVNCSEETPEVDQMMTQYNVEGYPTIKLLKDGQVVEYDAKPSKETLTQFLNTVL
jgi:thiol-disulfide isomerase/thioredoxin